MSAEGSITPENIRISGQLGPRALRILLRAQEIVSARGSYRYLEIGSYLGRSLQAHLQDADCAQALSIDLRPDVARDERGSFDIYAGITAEDMRRELSQVCSEAEMAKLECVTGTSDVLRARPPYDRFDLAFIDGEHTNAAVFRDFLNVLGVMKDESVICFDDTTLVYASILNALTLLESRGQKHAVAYGKGNVTVLAIGAWADEVIGGFDRVLLLSGTRVAERARLRIAEVANADAPVASFSSIRAGAAAKALRSDG